jgi:hypothetical protein
VATKIRSSMVGAPRQAAQAAAQTVVQHASK